MSSTITSRIFSVPCSWYVRYAASAAAAISGRCSCSAMASTSSSVRPQRATQSSSVIMPSTDRRVVAPEPKPKRNPDYSNVSNSLRHCGLPKATPRLFPNSSDNLQSFKVSGSYVYEYPCGLLFFQDVGSRRVADRGMGITSDGRRGYSLSAPGPKPSGQIGPPAAVMLLRAGQPGVGDRRR
jgi:hypothetical protein